MSKLSPRSGAAATDRRRGACLVAALLAASGACSRSEPTPAASPADRLTARFADAIVDGAPPPYEPGELIDWRFDRPWVPLPETPPAEANGDDAATGDAAPPSNAGPGAATTPAAEPPLPAPGPDGSPQTEAPADSGATADPEAMPGPIVHGVEALGGVQEHAVVDGRLKVRASGPALLLFPRLPEGDAELYGVELRVRAPEGARVGARAEADENVNRAYIRRSMADFGLPGDSIEVAPSPDVQTCRIELPGRTQKLSDVRRLALQLEDCPTLEIESVRLVTRAEHLATQAANVDWRGLGEVFRRTLLQHATETVHFDVELPARPWLELAVGTPDPRATTFTVEVTPKDGGATTRALRRTVTTPNRWEETPVALDAWAGRRVRLTFRVAADLPSQVGYFGGLIVHDRGATPFVDGAPRPDAPRTVILVAVDTFRRDHLDLYGYDRETAPFLRDLAAQGAWFRDNISQASWTKVSMPSLLTSLYPATSGVTSMSSKLPDEATTLAESFQAAGYATFATSSVMFTGRSTNLQQGLDVLHERASVGELGHSPSKTARTFVDRLTAWLEAHEEQPTFVFLHVFDPHSPFDTYAPYSGVWSQAGALDAQKKDIDAVLKVDDDIRRGGDMLPDRAQLEAAGVSPEAFVAREVDWYDESILALDAEMKRLHERLEELGLADDALIVLTSDHGEEFLEHGRHFHGNSTYGEMTNVPLLFWGPRWIPAGTVVDETVQNVDVYPTLMDLCGLPTPAGLQGASLAPLLRDTGEWRPRPAFASKFSDKKEVTETKDIESFAVVSRGYRLVHNVKRPEGHPEFELYDHVEDPLNTTDIADQHPEKVEVLARELELWRKWTRQVALTPQEGAEEEEAMSEAELEQLRQLGYVGK